MTICYQQGFSEAFTKPLFTLYEQVPLGRAKTLSDIACSFAGSRYVWTAWDEHVLVAAGRMVADGVDLAYLCDLAVLPSYRKKGIGSEIVRRLIAEAEHHEKILLYTSPDHSYFYQRAGFKKMTTAMARFKNERHAMEIGVI